MKNTKNQKTKKAPTILGTLGLGAAVAAIAVIMSKKRRQGAEKK